MWHAINRHVLTPKTHGEGGGGGGEVIQHHPRGPKDANA